MSKSRNFRHADHYIICRLDPESGVCTGGLRSGDEIAGWGGDSEARRRAVNQALASRRAADPAGVLARAAARKRC